MPSVPDSSTNLRKPPGLYHFHAEKPGAGAVQLADQLKRLIGSHGIAVSPQALPGPYPEIDTSSVLAAAVALSRLPDDAVVLIDAETLPGLAGVLVAESRRLAMVALVPDQVWWNGDGQGVEQAVRRNIALVALTQMRHVVVRDASRFADITSLGIDGSASGFLVALEPGGLDASPAFARLTGCVT